MHSTALTFGQRFLFQEIASKEPHLHRPWRKSARPRRHALRNVALAGLALGFTGSVLIQCLAPSSSRGAHKPVAHSRSDAALVAAAHR